MSEAKSPEQLLSAKQNEEKWEEKKIEVLLEAASIAIKRARYVFILVNIAAILIFAAQFNAYFPWIRNVVMRTNDAHTKEVVNEILTRNLQLVSVPLLGINFSAFDLTVIGSLAALLLAIWFYYCVRREYLVINEVYKIAEDSPYIEKRAYLYHGIAHYFVYTTAAKRERPEVFTPQTTARAVVKALFFVPAWLPLLIVVFDIISLIRPPQFTQVPGCESLWCVLKHFNQHKEGILRMVFAIILSLFSLSQCWGAYTWDRATRILVDKLQKKVESEAKRS